MLAISAGLPFALLAFICSIRNLPLGFGVGLEIELLPVLFDDPCDSPVETLVGATEQGELNAPGLKSLDGDVTDVTDDLSG